MHLIALVTLCEGSQPASNGAFVYTDTESSVSEVILKWMAAALMASEEKPDWRNGMLHTAYVMPLSMLTGYLTSYRMKRRSN